jgi:hypothetical protein
VVGTSIEGFVQKENTEYSEKLRAFTKTLTPTNAQKEFYHQL